MPTITLTLTDEQLAAVESARLRGNDHIADPAKRIPDAAAYVQMVVNGAIESYARMAADPQQQAADAVARAQREAADAIAAANATREAAEAQARSVAQQLADAQAQLAAIAAQQPGNNETSPSPNPA